MQDRTYGRQKYEEHQDLCKNIGERIGYRINKMFGSRSEAGRLFAKLTGLSPASATDLVTNYCKYLARFISSEANGHKVQTMNGTQLDRFAMFLHMLKIHENDTVIGMVRQVNPEFDYSLDSKLDS